MSVQKSLLAFTFPSATVQMGNVIRLYVKDHSPMWFTFYCQTRNTITSFNKQSKPKKEKGIDVSLLMEQHKGTAICLSALHTDLTYPWTTWFQGLATKHRHVHLPWGFGEGPLSSQSPLTSIFPLLDYFGKFHSDHVYFFGKKKAEGK